jgi:hypothetical protein
MAVKFYTEGHRYESIDMFNPIDWVSNTKFIAMFKKPFDAERMALKSSQKKDGKWYGLSPQKILDIWKAENIRSTTLGTWYHNKKELGLLNKSAIEYKGRELPIISSIVEGGVKYAPDQKLKDGVYPEHLCFLLSTGTCGQMDRVNVCDGYVDIEDYKSNKDLKKPAYVNWEGITEKMQPPLMHLEATKLNEYALQLSLGMYMVLRHNPQLKPGKLTIPYVTFEIEAEDEWGYPVMRLDQNNEPILKSEEIIELPYLRREVEIMFEYLKQKRAKHV